MKRPIRLICMVMLCLNFLHFPICGVAFAKEALTDEELMQMMQDPSSSDRTLSDSDLTRLMQRVTSVDGAYAEYVFTKLLVAFMERPDHFLDVVSMLDEETGDQVLRQIAHEVFVYRSDDEDNRRFEAIVDVGCDAPDAARAQAYRELKDAYIEASKTNGYTPYSSNQSGGITVSPDPSIEPTSAHDLRTQAPIQTTPAHSIVSPNPVQDAQHTQTVEDQGEKPPAAVMEYSIVILIGILALFFGLTVIIIRCRRRYGLKSRGRD